MNKSGTAEEVVYNFEFYEAVSKGFVLAPFKARRADVEQRYQGRILEGTAEVVPADALDPQGRYRRVATGWGALAEE